MPEKNWEVFSYEKPEPERERRVLGDEDIKVRSAKSLGLVKRKIAKIIYPDELYSREEDSLDLDTLPREARQNDYFKEFSYHVLKFNFGVIPDDWKAIEYIQILLKVQHTRDQSVIIHMPSIFPTDESVQIGERLDKYNLTKSLSVKTPNLQVPVLGVDLPISGGIDLTSQVLKNIDYGLKIPRVLSATTGNNEAAWKYYQNEALGAQGQYRCDMVVGLPINKSRNYNVRMTLNASFKLALNPTPIEHEVPINFYSN